MKRVTAIALSLLCVATFALAQANREKLAGFETLAFGMSISEAKVRLGPKAVEAEWAGEDKSLRLKTLTQLDRHFPTALGQFVTYYFDASGKLIASAFVSKFQTRDEDDLAACFKASEVMKILQQRYGPPDSQNERDEALYFAFAFKDGNDVQARLEVEDEDCELRVVFRNAEAKKLRLLDD
jgi:hypothetical protein